MSATPDNTLADLERLVADLQRQLAERTAERDEAREQQTATAEVLQVINSSSGDLVPVFEAMLDKAIRLCEATHGHLLAYDGERFHRSAARGNARAMSSGRGRPVLLGHIQPHRWGDSSAVSGSST